MTTIPRTNIDIFPINLGGNTFGWTSDREQSFAVLDTFVEAGGNFIDTADSYSEWSETSPGGTSETILGEWMKERSNRDKVIIATKVGGRSTRKGLGRENVEAALNDSLARLQTDYIDIYYAHYDDETVSIEDQVKHAHELVQSGHVRHIALSNYTGERMKEWFEVATCEGLTLPVAIQPAYNLINGKNFEEDFAPIAREYDAAVFSYFSLASGVLTGKYRTREDFEGKARASFATDLLTGDALKVIDALVEVADAHSAEPTSVALAWLLARGVTAPIVSASTPEQLPAIVAAKDLKLTEAELEKLDSVSKVFA